MLKHYPNQWKPGVWITPWLWLCIEMLSLASHSLYIHVESSARMRTFPDALMFNIRGDPLLTAAAHVNI